jgi:hypothetical protein
MPQVSQKITIKNAASITENKDKECRKYHSK